MLEFLLQLVLWPIWLGVVIDTALVLLTLLVRKIINRR